MPWRYMAIRYGWQALVYHLFRSSRWSDDEKTTYLFVMGALLSGPFFVAQVLWLLTGRGPIQWLYRPTVAFVNPFPRWNARDPQGAMERVLAAGREKYGEVPSWPPPRGTRVTTAIANATAAAAAEVAGPQERPGG